MTAKANLLYQGQATATAAQVVAASINTEITRIFVCNTGPATTFTIHHDDNGSTYNPANALYFTYPLAAAGTAGSTFEIEADGNESGITLKSGGTIGIAAGVAGQVTFSVYGSTQDTQGIMATGTRR